MPCRATGQKVEGSQTTTDKLTLPTCFITLRSEPAADNDQLEAGDDEEAPPEPPERVTHRPLSPLARLYVYALHGCLCEVGFTAVWDWWETKDRRLAGHTSLWALPMYALAIFLIEGLRGRLLAQRCPLLLRMLVYTLFIYLWEFSWGVVLSFLGACPWDYSGFSYNLAGLVTLEYALPWALASLIAEQHVIRKTLRVRLTN
ncbi:transmembrane protein 229B isoform X1 [Salmo salar]|uniref:Transmembrane protein 229B isoform X1 n=1 Tax=Salmo salar TaxID=8030 RepID=A0A1S3N2H7_SALSA|nr:transmembrane protein 229B isoform X1 [Salmo salar]|eukprot:XP_014009602.1 PREDICTED: transmembrane protein 229B-like isoform X1 [Salmo salar]